MLKTFTTENKTNSEDDSSGQDESYVINIDAPSTSQATSHIRPTQKSLKPKSLIQYCRTRWNTVYDMFDRLVELKWLITAVLGDTIVTKLNEACTLDLKGEYWDLIKDLLQPLKHLKTATEMLSLEKNVSLSNLIPILYVLINVHLSIEENDSQIIKKFKTDIITSVTNRFNLKSAEIVTSTSTSAIASFLDPRHKHLSFFSQSIKDALEDHVNLILAEQPVQTKKVDCQSESTVQEKKKPQELFFGANYGKTEETNGDEISQYKKEKNLNQDDCPLEWWRVNENNFPMLANLAKKYLCIPASSVASERNFSAAGQVITKRRSRLLPETAEMLLFVNRNLNYDAHE